MRAKRGFINYRRKSSGSALQKLNYHCKAHSFYQVGVSIRVVCKKGSVFKQEWKNPLLKIARRQFNKKSFLTLSTCMSSKSTSKPIGVRMGKGKGKIDTSLSVARKGQPLISFSEFSELNVQKLFNILRGRTSSKAGLRAANIYF